MEETGGTSATLTKEEYTGPKKDPALKSYTKDGVEGYGLYAPKWAPGAWGADIVARRERQYTPEFEAHLAASLPADASNALAAAGVLSMGALTGKPAVSRARARVEELAEPEDEVRRDSECDSGSSGGEGGVQQPEEGDGGTKKRARVEPSIDDDPEAIALVESITGTP